MFLASKCKSLISGYSCSLDPTIGLDLWPSDEDDNVTVVTSNVTQITRIQHTHLSIAATAQHLLGNPLPQYLNVITIATNQAIADTGAMSILIMDGVDAENKCIATQPFTIN
jgi:hypothetical protein